LAANGGGSAIETKASGGTTSGGDRRVVLRLRAADLRRAGQSGVVADFLGRSVALDSTRREWTGNLISTAAYECLEAAVRLAPDGAEVDLTFDAAGDMLSLTCGFVVDKGFGTGVHELAATVGRGGEERFATLLRAGDLDALELSELGLGMVALRLASEASAEVDGDGRLELAFRMPLTKGQGEAND
jgi:hypothetical protein